MILRLCFIKLLGIWISDYYLNGVDLDINNKFLYLKYCF